MRPLVVTVNSASADGRLAAAADTPLLFGDPRWQALEEWSTPPDADGAYRRVMTAFTPQATLEGSGSFVPETVTPTELPPPEPGLAAGLHDDFLPREVVERPGAIGWFTVVDGRGRGRDWTKDGAVFGTEWEGWHLLVLVCAHTPAAYLAYLRRESIPYLIAGDGRVDLALALEKLHDRLGVATLVSTAGGKLNGALVRAGLVDEVNIEVLPGLIGGLATPSLFDAPELGPDEPPVRLELVDTEVLPGGRVWLRYRISSAG